MQKPSSTEDLNPVVTRVNSVVTTTFARWNWRIYVMPLVIHLSTHRRVSLLPNTRPIWILVRLHKATT